jgi:hypothetical protein
LRIWDLPAGYLNRQSLLAEHRELHGIHSILSHGKKGYSRHPETLRWTDAISGLVCRHNLLAAEMRLRGYTERTPLVVPTGIPNWPEAFVTEPAEQISVLRQKYVNKQKGRIPLPGNAQELWAHHKYSVMARSPHTYRRIGRAVERKFSSQAFDDLARELVLILRERPSTGRLANAIEHMWGHVRAQATEQDIVYAKQGPLQMLLRTQELAMRQHERYLLVSTALSELTVFFWQDQSAKSQSFQ